MTPSPAPTSTPTSAPAWSQGPDPLRKFRLGLLRDKRDRGEPLTPAEQAYLSSGDSGKPPTGNSPPAK